MTERADTRPNVVLINCDDLGYGDLGCYGSTINDTPRIDALAASGARLTDFYMASPVCSPSRASMLTGSYPLRIGFGGPSTGGLGGVLFPGWPVGLNPAEVTVARMLSEGGYATLAVGKWHCGDQPEFLPTNHGFDEWFGLPYSNDMGRQSAPTDRPTMDEIGELLASAGFEYPWVQPPLPLVEGNDVIETQPDQRPLTDRYIDRCVEFIRENAHQPFFLYLAHMHVHLPLYVHERFEANSDNGAYGAAIAAIDEATGRIVDELERLGLSGDTLLVFTSDNGALAEERGGSGTNQPLRGSKGTTWEGGQRVPCIVSWPGRISEGTTVAEMVTALDLLPTLAHITETEVPTDRTLDGNDVCALLGLGGSAPDADRPFFYIGDGNIEAVRSGPWKLHVRKGDQLVSELYDLASDVAEANDLAATHPEVVERLATLVELGRTELGDAATGVTGTRTRPIGRVDKPRVLVGPPGTPEHTAEYDLPHRG